MIIRADKVVLQIRICMKPWRYSCFFEDLLPFSSLKTQYKFAVAGIYKGKFLLTNLQ